MPKLNQSFVKSVTVAPGESQTFYMDDELTGFGVRVSPTKKVFYLQMRVGSKVLKRKIGPDGHPNSPTSGHLKFPHPERGVTMG